MSATSSLAPAKHCRDPRKIAVVLLFLLFFYMRAVPMFVITMHSSFLAAPNQYNFSNLTLLSFYFTNQLSNFELVKIEPVGIIIEIGVMAEMFDFARIISVVDVLHYFYI
jgi:hypothetical protein